jgi:prepilin-type N-terminal cleavage/methylation domain-containing protein
MPSCPYARKRFFRSGFSLVELLVAIAIMGLILAIGIPFFGTILHRSRVDAVSREFNMSVLSARLQAIKRGQNVGVVVSTDSSSSIGAYHNAVLFLDANANGVLDAGDTVIRTDALLPDERRVTLSIDSPDASSPSTAAATTYIVFSPFGSVASGGDKGVYVSDLYGNVLQVRVTTPATGKLAITKLVPGGTPLYQLAPWKWS